MRTLARAGWGLLLSVLGATCVKAPRPPVVEEASSQGTLFDLGVPFHDEHGRERHLTDFRGRPFVLSMIYTRCTSVCPRVTADLQRLERSLSTRALARVRFVLISLDPVHDDPEALVDFASRYGLERGDWHLLVPSEKDLRTVTGVLEVRFRPEKDGDIAHSATFLVVDGDGVIRHRQTGITETVEDLREAVEATLR